MGHGLIGDEIEDFTIWSVPVLAAATIGLWLVSRPGMVSKWRLAAASALASAGIVTEAQVEDLVLTGGREVSDGALFGFLGDVIPLPWGQVISIGDVLVLIGLALVVASILRRYEVGRPSGTNRQGRGGSGDYRSALDALGRGPAPRKGPGLHPSRMGSSGSGRRRR